MNSFETEKIFIELYDKYYKKIYNYILRSVLIVEIAEDLTSNTFFKVLNYFKKNNQQINNFSSWLYKIATNEILMHHRYNGGKKYISIDENNIQIEIMDKSNISSDNFIDFFVIKNAIKKLKPKEIVIIETYYFENLGYEEMSKIFNIKEVTLRSLIHRILKKLNNILKFN
jgi:RNA polymerase sigma-70 factor, ECF subfamily